jgi:hypothetical protein
MLSHVAWMCSCCDRCFCFLQRPSTHGLQVCCAMVVEHAMCYAELLQYAALAHLHAL